MDQAIQFETVVDKGIIHIPEQFIKSVPRTVRVTLAPMYEPKIMKGAKSKASDLTSEDFSAIRINTENFIFDREEANERR